jgi:Flp pilus assembly protein TadG
MEKRSKQGNFKEQGQSLVELAVSLTILLMLLAGTIDFGRAFFTWVTLRDAAQEGAVYASIDPTNDLEIEERIFNVLERSNTIPDPRSNVEVSHDIDAAPCLGNTVTMVVDYPTFPITVPFLSTVLGTDTLSIHATVKDTILYPACGE